mmetsp:Transcript_34189/g.80111  ORF Transcript_34189/g.80111 Transcript_34189/m.80111 type:complete len:292 (+) Transcript_34189:753-1628(+)
MRGHPGMARAQRHSRQLPVLAARARAQPSASGVGLNFGCSVTMMTLMLSREPSRRQWSIRASHTAPRSQARRGAAGAASISLSSAAVASGAATSGSSSLGRPFLSMSPTLLTTSCELITSQMPSHANTMNSSSSGTRGCTITSGKAVTACSLAPTVSQRLYTKSPSARETARSPFTRLNLTVEPAFSMRSFSPGLKGLWSYESATAAPPRLSTARESPVLAQTTCLGVTSVITEVEPLWSCPDSTTLRPWSSVSSAIKATSKDSCDLATKSSAAWSHGSSLYRCVRKFCAA